MSSNQYIYGQQQIYNQNIQYTTDINTTGQIQMEGGQYGVYDASIAYQEIPNGTVTMAPTVYQQEYEQYNQQIEQQPIYLDQGQYIQQGQPIYLEGGQIGQPINYQTGNQMTGYEQQLYQNQIQQQQPNQNLEYQYYQQQQQLQQQQQQQQQPQIIQNQKTNNTQRQPKIVRQIIQQQKTNIPQNVPNTPITSNTPRLPIGSRNPNIKRQYQQNQNQNTPIINQGNINTGGYIGAQMGQKLTEVKNIQNNQNQNLEQNPQKEKPQIDEDFQPNIPLANSILNQSKIQQLQQNQNQNQLGVANNMNSQITMSKVTPLQQDSQNLQNMQNLQKNQNYQQQPYFVARRNPNLNIKKYENSNNDSHFVKAEDPGLSSMGMAMNNNMGMNQNNNSIEQNINNINNINSIQKNMEYSNGVFNGGDDDDDMKPEVGEGNTVLDSQMSNIGKSGMKSLGNSNMNLDMNMDNDFAVSRMEFIGESKMENVEQELDDKFIEKKLSNEEIEKEIPIEEKTPDQSNINDLGNENNQMINNKIESEVIDIDDKLEYLPTAIMIMKGNGELLPPPKKKKYRYY